MVAMTLIAPMIELIPIRWIAKMANDMLELPWIDSGGYRVQPPAGAPPGSNSVLSSKVNANGRIQNDPLFIRGSAMSGAPILIGISQRPEQRRVGKECVSTGSIRWAPDQ